jgi:hypothetical protein
MIKLNGIPHIWDISGLDDFVTGGVEDFSEFFPGWFWGLPGAGAGREAGVSVGR